MTLTDHVLRQRSVYRQTAKEVSKKRECVTDFNKKFASEHRKLQAVTFSFTQRVWARAVIAISLIIIVYFYNKSQGRESTFALAREHLTLRIQKFPCSSSYSKEMQEYPQCVPRNCGRFIADKLIESKEVDVLQNLAENIINLAGGSKGGASILDLHSGALSQGDEFVNVYKMPQAMEFMKAEHLRIYRLVKDKIKLAIADQFSIEPHSLHLTYPTFFSQLTNSSAESVHDEYWHEHVDKETYPAFHYTSLLYLNTFNKDFKGGRFVFIDGSEENRTIFYIEPKKGRVSAFTSGEENRHHVEKVSGGTRFALTISFTCDHKYAISDRKLDDISSKTSLV
uniref:Fe2OG dioxygenase domain-containing protein n=1 Tax=Glossina brevipalpis TaxID=37001 RepID=A0A1A9WES7_9MUSC